MAFFEKPAAATHGRFYIWLLAGAVAVGLLWPLDTRVDNALDVTRNPALHDLAWWCSRVGEGWVVAVFAIFTATLYVFLDLPRSAANVFFVGMVSLLTGLAATILRVLFGRTRPTAHVAQGFYGVWQSGHWLIGKYAFSSFPSGHAATAVGLAAAAWMLHRGWGAVAGIYALAVMWSRIALQCHHLSDVLASTVLAIAMAVLLKPVLLPSIEFQFGNLHRAVRKK
ncbi:MAG: phosphatase PAP2 family protein [Verrucomicrobiota bacterium]|jgi:membrane-associated phospholipid phosphatase